MLAHAVTRARIPGEALSDKDREIKIAELQRRIERVDSQTMRRRIWKRIRDLINQRSPEQIARMERAKGLL